MAEDRDDDVSADPNEQAEVAVSSLRPNVHAVMRSRGRLWYRIVGSIVLVALALALVGTLVWLRPALPVGSDNAALAARPSDLLTVDTMSLGIPCVDQAVWSPDSRSVVLAGTSACNGPTQNEMLVVFDARTGAVRARITIRDTDIQRTVPPPDGTSWAKTDLSYGQQLYWSPDGRRIVLPFTESALVKSEAVARDGIVVLDNRLGAMRIVGGVDRTLPTPLPGGGNFGPEAVVRWDLSEGKDSMMTLPMGLAYAWDADGTLSASDVLGQTPDAQPPAVSSGLVGNPIGGNTFTLWQNGEVQFADAADCSKSLSGTPSPNYYLVSLTTSAWSPDGRYLALDLSAYGRLPVMPPTSGSSSCFNFIPAAQWPQLPIHDDGMRAALALVDGMQLQSIQLAWSPDGRRLAVARSDMASGAPALSLYDCASGQVRKTIDTPDLVPSQAGDQPFSTLAWSPDGTHLLVTGPVPVIVVLGPKTLGG